jgi:hypothetical protein
MTTDHDTNGPQISHTRAKRGTSMQPAVRPSVTALAVAAFVCLAALASAQAPVRQIRLSENQIESFIAAHKDMAEAFDKAAAETADAAAEARLDAMEKQLDAVARKFGFKDHKEYDDVATNIAMVIFGIDPETKAFTDPPTQAKKDLDDAKVDKSLSETKRRQLVEDLTEQLKLLQPIMYPSNVDLVRKYYDKILPLLQ